jgi:inositol phosphorylceramide mannosyltransferase catalytic subunit
MTTVHRNLIPKKLHMIWIGDEAKRPDGAIQSWRDNHPGWEFTLWGNKELHGGDWKGHRQIERFLTSGHFEGAADLMRYEILYKHGGVYVDADSVSLRPLDDWLLQAPLFAIWESEHHRPHLVANGFIGSVPAHPALAAMIKKTSRMNDPIWRRAWPNPFRWEEVPPWKSVGPVFFTKIVLPFCPEQAMILPSILFLPKHHLDKQTRASSLVYAEHRWQSTFRGQLKTVASWR